MAARLLLLPRLGAGLTSATSFPPCPSNTLNSARSSEKPASAGIRRGWVEGRRHGWYRASGRARLHGGAAATHSRHVGSAPSFSGSSSSKRH
eukprot:359606-Chlamydomonas_euryale.AAC.5